MIIDNEKHLDWLEMALLIVFAGLRQLQQWGCFRACNQKGKTE